jgi:drug/metabolite transporter (DMT)-like permease
VSRARADALVLSAALIWGFAFYFQKIAMADVGPFQFTGIRAVIAAGVLAPFAMLENRKAATPVQSLFPVAVYGGMAFAMGGLLQQQGLITATVTNTSFLTALYVVLTPFHLWLLRGEKPSLRIWCAAGLAFAGVWALGGGALQGFSNGDWLVAASALFWSFYMVATSASSLAARPMGYTCLSFATIAVITVPASVWFETYDQGALWRAMPALLYVGVLSSALTFALLSVALRHIAGARVAILLATETVFAAATGYVLLHERLTMLGWIGAALALAAVVLIKSDSQKDGKAARIE